MAQHRAGVRARNWPIGEVCQRCTNVRATVAAHAARMTTTRIASWGFTLATLGMARLAAAPVLFRWSIVLAGQA